MPNSNARKEREKARRRDEMRAKYGDDWRPTRCPFCVNSEAVRKAAVTLPPTTKHTAPMTIFCAVSVRPHPQGTVVKTDERAHWHGLDWTVCPCGKAWTTDVDGHWTKAQLEGWAELEEWEES